MGRERSYVLPPWIHELLLGVGLFLAGLAINSMNNIATKIEDLRVLVAGAAQELTDHEARLTRIEVFLSGGR